MKFGGEHLGFKNRGAYMCGIYHGVYVEAHLPYIAEFITG